MSSLTFITSVPLALSLLFLTVLIPQSCSHGKVQEQNNRLLKTTYQRPNREKRCQQLVSSWKTDLWHREERHNKLLPSADYGFHLKKKQRKTEILNICSKFLGMLIIEKMKNKLCSKQHKRYVFARDLIYISYQPQIHWNNKTIQTICFKLNVNE